MREDHSKLKEPALRKPDLTKPAIGEDDNGSDGAHSELDCNSSYDGSESYGDSASASDMSLGAQSPKPYYEVHNYIKTQSKNLFCLANCLFSACFNFFVYN